MSLNKNILFIFFLLGFVSQSCDNPIENQLKLPDSKEQNKYSNPSICKIYTLGYNRNSQDLKPFLYDSNSKNKIEALYTCASLQDSSLSDFIAKSLYDADDKVRSVAGFALSQLKTQKAAKLLREAIDFEPSIDVRATLIRNLGRCGGHDDLNYVLDLDIRDNQLLLLEAQAMALSYFGSRNIHSAKSTRLVINRISSNIPAEIKEVYSKYFLRIRGKYLKDFFVQLKKIYHFSNDKGKINILPVFINIPTESTLSFVKQELEKEQEYRVKIQALKVISVFNYELIRDFLLESVQDINLNIAIAASEILQKKYSASDFETYFTLSQKVANHRVAANLLRVAALTAKNQKSFTSTLIDIYESQNNDYAKSFYLSAFSNLPLSYKFVASEMFSSKSYIIKSASISALKNMCYHSKFDSINQASIKNEGINIKKEFAYIFKKAIQSGDAALIAESADLLSDKKLNFINLYPNTFFLQQAIEDCKLPRDIEAYLSLKKALKANNINSSSIEYQQSYALLDWNFIRKIGKNQVVLIKTNKGDIKIKLMVEKAPATVANFVKDVLKKNYNHTFIHRAVPNFVVQSGDYIRGDGWGTTDLLLRSEFSDMTYNEGCVGIASAGKDTESVQWFITQSSTPHLDGKYTLFAKVVEGMNIVHKLEVGDEIKSMELL